MAQTGKHISQWYGFSRSKCPRCRVGNIFNGKTYDFKNQKTNKTCSHCKLTFEREPGYFYVAMFVSYAMNVAQLITISVVSYVLGLRLDLENIWYFIAILAVTILLFAPLNYRYSRVILLYWLSPGLRYDPRKSVKKQS